jgi:DtxR family Mn-dependent transcriptional regulator
MNDSIYESGEDYLETILRLEKRLGQVRSIDIANEMTYSKPSISRAMKILSEKGMLFMDEHKYIHLTDEGLAKAKEIYHRHLLIREVLIDILHVSPDQAEQDACRVEHIVSPETISRLEEKLAELKERH